MHIEYIAPFTHMHNIFQSICKKKTTTTNYLKAEDIKYKNKIKFFLLNFKFVK